MQISEVSLTDALHDCAERIRRRGGKVTLGCLNDEFVKRYPSLWDKYEGQFAREGFQARGRRILKRSTNAQRDTGQLFFDLGLADLDLPYELAVPSDVNNPLDSKEWKEVEVCTVPDLDSHVTLLNGQMKADRRQRDAVLKLRARIVQLIGSRTDLTVADAARLAKGRAA